MLVRAMLTGRTTVDVLNGKGPCKGESACCSSKNDQVCSFPVVREGERVGLWLTDVFRTVPPTSASSAFLSQV